MVANLSLPSAHAAGIQYRYALRELLDLIRRRKGVAEFYRAFPGDRARHVGDVQSDIVEAVQDVRRMRARLREAVEREGVAA